MQLIKRGSALFKREKAPEDGQAPPAERSPSPAPSSKQLSASSLAPPQQPIPKLGETQVLITRKSIVFHISLIRIPTRQIPLILFCCFATPNCSSYKIFC